MSRIWHGAIALIATVSLVTQFILVLDRDGSVVNFFSYFTIQSNILVAIACWLIVIRPDRGGTAFGILRLGGLVGITITGIIFSTILAGAVELDGIDWWTDKGFHYVVPAMAVIGYVFIKPRTRLDKSALWFLAWAIAWLAYTLIRAEAGSPRYLVEDGNYSKVPYDFLDVDAHGAGAVAVVSVGVLVIGLALSAFYVWLSQRDDTGASA
ncbi:Pr6Pr family membrane protein [Aeromicrobium panaciterrae]|uniref:Pr6Pr family membrane protein n=1 Tax=Aeromicrobium panaciterrae TaxID=363861 RepID=UPI0031E2DA05